MPIILRLLLTVLAGTLIMGARLATRHCASLQPAKTAVPLAKSPKAYWCDHFPFPLSQRAAFYEKPLPRAVRRRLISL